MKKALCVLLCLLMLGGFLPAWAMEDAPVQENLGGEPQMQELLDETTTEEEQGQEIQEGKTDTEEDEMGEPETDGAQTTALHIDSANRYEGMERSWKAGYTPTVSGGAVALVLPLEADGALQDDRMTVKLDLGATERTPFVYKNYEKTVQLTQQKINETETTKPVYYVRFDLPLSSERYNGVYPVTALISAKDETGSPIAQSFTLYVTITDGKDPNETPEQPQAAEPQAPAPTSNPIILVSSSALTPATVTAGEEFTAAVTFRNTSEKKPVQNLVVTVGYDTAHFKLLEDSNTIFLSKLGKGETKELLLHFSSDLSTAEGSYPVELSFRYDDPDAVTLASTGTVLVPVRQALRLEMTMPAVPTSVNAGDTIPMSFQVMNLGRGKVCNVRCEVSGLGLLPTGTAFVGDMEPGTEGKASLNLFVGTKDMSEGYKGTEQYGSTTGTVKLIYEEKNGTEHIEGQTFTTTIEKPVVAAVSEQPKQAQNTALQWQVSVLTGALILTIGAIAVLLRMRRRHETL